MIRRLAALLVFLQVLVGCRGGGTAQVNTPPPKAPVDPWVLSTLDSRRGEPAVLWNGLIGVRVGRSGAGIDGQGKPLPFFMIDEYDTSGEEKIRTLPNPLAFVWRVEGEQLVAEKALEYRQSLDMRTGLLRTAWTQNLGGQIVACEVNTAIHPSQRQLTQKWVIKLQKPARVEVESLFPAVFSPSGTNIRTAQTCYGVEGRHEEKPGSKLSGRATNSASLEHVVSLGERPTSLRSKAADPPEPMSHEEIVAAASKVWAERWKTDIEIDGPAEDQQAVRSFLFYLRSAIHPDGGMGISPMGLSSQTYNGHVFWDADIWVFPALALLDPEAASAIPQYRIARLPAALSLYKDWVNQGRPTGSGKMGPIEHRVSRAPGAKYPWESSVSGKETVPGPSRFQDHISGSVVFAMRTAEALGLAKPPSELYEGVEAFYFDRSVPKIYHRREIHGTMSPDEHHTGDNDLYTNLLAEWCVNCGYFADAALGAPGLVINKSFSFTRPQDGVSFLTYDNDPVRSYKQAAAVLAIYPLQYHKAEEQAKVMMERFADKVTPNGPAMSDSVHALIWARIGEDEKAYTTWRKSWMEFTDHPLMLFSEKRRKAVTYFTTGAAGCLQTVIYGFLGFRIDSGQVPDPQWEKELHGGRWLTVKPNLPKSWKKVTLKNFTVLGQRYTLTATHDRVDVTQGEP